MFINQKRGETLIGNKVFFWGARTYVMGVVNVTPDSFSGDGVSGDIEKAVETAIHFQQSGADLIDVGGESTRPASIYFGAQTVSLQEELSRVIPAIREIAKAIVVPISVDTYKSKVAEEAILAGASMVNDVWALQHDSDMAGLVAEARIPVVLMHNQLGTSYNDLIPDVVTKLFDHIEYAKQAGILEENIVVDPGIGFGKDAAQNLEILRRLDDFDALGRPILVGMSRKSTIGHVLNLPIEQRIEGTAATVALSVGSGADIVRVHDVKEMVRVARMSDAIVRGWEADTD